VDLAEPGGAEQLVGEAVDRHGAVDDFVNNVGGARLRLDRFLQVSDTDFEALLLLNFTS
jgi:short-subunit dehydrogenase